MLKTDRTLALAFIVVSIFLFFKTGEFIDETAKVTLSPAFFPRLIIILLIICCSWLVLKSKMTAVSFPAISQNLIAAAFVIGYAALIEPLGYFLITPLFLFFLPLTMGYRRWLWLVFLAAGGTIFAYIVFYHILGVPLPLGILENIGG